MRFERSGKRKRGQALVESALILVVVIASLMGTVDVAQMMFIHHSLTERVRSALRWGVVRPWDGTGDQMANLVIHNSTVSPGVGVAGYLGMTRANVQVTYSGPDAENPNDERLTMSVVNLDLPFFSPFLAGTIRNNYSVTQSAIMAYKP